MTEQHRHVLFSDRPWLVVIHQALETLDEAYEAQDALAEKLTLGEKIDRYATPFKAGLYWHSDGRYVTPIANMHTTFGNGSGVALLAPALVELDQAPTETQSEQHALEFIGPMQKKNILGTPVARIPIKSGVTIVWREVPPTPTFTDTAHAVYAKPGRTSAVTEYLLEPSKN